MERRDLHLPDDALVVRGGIMLRRDLVKAATMMSEISGELGISTRAGADVSWEDLASDLPQPQVRLSTAGRLRAAGFEVALTGDRERHATVYLGAELTDDVLQRLTGAFEPPRANTHRKTT